MSSRAHVSERTGVDPVVIVDVAGRGHGVIAARPIAAGEIVLAFGGPVLLREGIRDFTHVLEIDTGVFLGASGGADDYVNHSCEPNCAVTARRGRVVLMTLRGLEVGEELTYDYATAMVTDPTRFACRCGAARCRGELRPWGELPARVRKGHPAREVLLPFVSGRGDSEHGN